MSGSLAERLWARVRKSTGCWEWIGGKIHCGYGIMWACTRATLVHRVSWQLAYGPIPDGLWVLHRCDNRLCVNPDHLFLGTHQDNMRDMVAKGRARCPQSDRTHCPRGHEYDAANTYYRASGHRQCRVCDREYQKRRRQSRVQHASVGA